MRVDDKQTAILKEWHIENNRAFGKVYGHPRFEDGTPVITSTIVRRSLTEAYGKVIIETRNTIYTCNVDEWR